MKDYLQMIPPRLLSLFITNIFRYTITRKNIQSDTVPESMNFAHYQHCARLSYLLHHNTCTLFCVFYGLYFVWPW